MPEVDRRVRRSRKLLREALFSLVLEKDYPEITIKEITERADVAYITFFRHYDSIDGLLIEGLGQLIEEMRERMTRVAQEAGEDPQDLTEGRVIFQHVRERSDLYRVLLSSQGAHDIRRRVRDSIATMFQTTCRPLQKEGGLITGELAAHHIASSLLALIEWWLDGDMPFEIERMAQVYYRLILSATLDTVTAVQPAQA